MQNNNRGFRFCIFPGYNWCGPGCSGPGAPINAIDNACKEHDICYSLHQNRCQCDQQFLRRLRPLMNPCTKEGRHARFLYKYMIIQTFINCGFQRRY